MRRITFLVVLALLANFQGMAQELGAEEFQLKLNEQYADSAKSPLLEEDRLVFKALPFFPIDSTYIVMARFERTENSKPFEMKTSTHRLPVYEEYGTAHFEINGEPLVLHIYQSHRSREKEEYKNDLFLPFTDLTNGEESYGGGRFLDLKIPDSEQILIDFNKAYNPYCAYNHKYSCPVPPAENNLNVKISAGVKYAAKEH